MTRLLPEQEALLAVLCEAAKVNRKPFIASGTLAGDSIRHEGLTASPAFEWDDLDILIRKGLLHRSEGSRRKNYMRFTVTAEGLAHVAAPPGPKLRPPQVELLDAMCRAAQARSDGDFILIRAMQGTFIRHPGLAQPVKIAVADYDELTNAGLIRPLSLTGSSRPFAITTKGWDHWEALSADKDAVAKIEDSVRRLIDPTPDDGPYAESFKHWAVAEALLWTDRETPGTLTQIGHVCRESMQKFAAVFAAQAGAVVEGKPEDTVKRVRAGLTALAQQLPTTLQPFLDALLVYWGTVCDLTQRQEHGAAREGQPLEWEDARLVVTQTALVMFELRRAAGRVRT